MDTLIRVGQIVEGVFCGVLFWISINDFRQHHWVSAVLFGLMGITFLRSTWKDFLQNRRDSDSTA